MFSEELKRVFKLIKKTGDRVILYDSQNPDDSFVLMNISSYEKSVESQLDKEEEEISTSDNSLEIEKKDSDLELKKVKKETLDDGLTEEDLTDKINREISIWKSKEDESFFVEDNKNERFVKPWSIPSEVKQKAKEVE